MIMAVSVLTTKTW